MSCTRAPATAPSCDGSAACQPGHPPHDAAVSSDAALAENRVPDAGAPPIDAGPSPAGPPFRVYGSFSTLPTSSSTGVFQLHEPRLELQRPSCGRVGDATLCVSGSLH